MQPRMKNLLRCGALTLLLTTFTGCEHHEHMMQLQAKVAADSVHRMHILVGQAVGLVADGSSLQLAADMGMSPATDEMLRETGNDLISRGESMLASIEDVVTNQEPEDPESEPAYLYTRDLVQAAQVYVREAQTLRGEGDQAHSHHPAAHHAHLLVNNAVKAAVAGANNLMLVNMGVAADLQEPMRQGGQEMISDYSQRVHQAMGLAMSEMSGSTASSDAGEDDNGTHGMDHDATNHSGGDGDLNPRLHTYAQAATALISKLSEMEGDSIAGGGDHSGHGGDHQGHSGH